ncbi:MAG: histidine kinase [Parafilimonas sp.]|nr:histidine kinase [Parafilimonas sp.]
MQSPKRFNVCCLLWHCIFIFIILLHNNFVLAQTNNAYASISVEEGLSQGMIYDILQDREGFIWIATKNGLNRYDGYSFKVFTNDPYNQHSLSSNTILALFEDSKGRIWAGTENAGLNIYDKNTGQFHRIIHDAKDSNSISGDRIRAPIIELSNGKILVPTEGSGINIITLPNDFFEKNAKPAIKKLSLPNNGRIYGAGEDKNGNIYVAGIDSAVYKLDLSTNSFIKLKEGKFINNGYLTNDGNVWISRQFFLSTKKEIIPLFDERKIGNIILNPNYKPWMNFHLAPSFYDIAKWQAGKNVAWNKDIQLSPTAQVLSPFIIDRSGMLWAGTAGYGLRKYNTKASKFNLYADSFSVRFIVPVSPNNILLLSAFSAQWVRLKNDSIQKNVFSNIKLTKQIGNVLISKTGKYWFRSDEVGLFSYDDKTNQYITYPSIEFANDWDYQPMIEDSKGAIWFPHNGGFFTRIFPASNKIIKFSINNNPTKPMLPRALCTALYEDTEGKFWIGTEEGFAEVIFKNNDDALPTIKWFYNDSTNRNSLNYNYVSCFLDDPTEPKKYLWICTKGGGLNRLDKTNNSFIHLTTKDGLPNDVVYAILPDDEGNIWGSTNHGIFCLLKSKNGEWIFRNFTKADGLQDDEFNTGAYAKLPNGNLAFGGVNGLNIFDPKEVLTSSFTPNVFITSILVNNQPVEAGDKTGVLKNTIEKTKTITLNHLQDILTLEFSSLDFTRSAQNKYRYKLEGADKNWIESGTRRTATYLHLPARKYTFKVQGSNSQGIWSNNLAELNIIVLPPWWTTWWAYTLYALLFAATIFFITRSYLRRLFYKQQQRNKLLELEMQALRAQMNPHFIFNCLSSINGFILMNETQAASDYLTKFSRLIRMVLNNSKKSLISLEDELEMLRLYLDMENLRFNNGFDFTIDVDKVIDAENIFIPPLLFQPFAENAVWHGLMHKKERGKLQISLSAEDDVLKFVIKDNGIGRAAATELRSKSAEKNKSLGLQITKERLSLINGYASEKTFFEIEDVQDEKGDATGTRILLKIKFRETNHN